MGCVIYNAVGLLKLLIREHLIAFIFEQLRIRLIDGLQKRCDILRNIFSELLKRPSSGEDFEPMNAALTAIGLADGGVDDFHHGGSDFRADAVAGDEGNINGVGHVKNGFGGESDF